MRLHTDEDVVLTDAWRIVPNRNSEADQGSVFDINENSLEHVIDARFLGKARLRH